MAAGGGNSHCSNLAKSGSGTIKIAASARLKRRMKISNQPDRICVEQTQEIDDRLQKGQHKGAPDGAIDQVAERQAAGDRISEAAALDQRVDRASEVCAEHQREGHDRRNKIRIGK